MLIKFVNKYFTRVQNLVFFTPTGRNDQICGLHSFQSKKAAYEYQKDEKLLPKDAAALLPGWKIKRYENGASNHYYTYVHPNGARFFGIDKAHHFELKYQATKNCQIPKERLPENLKWKNAAYVSALLGDDWKVKQRKNGNHLSYNCFHRPTQALFESAKKAYNFHLSYKEKDANVEINDSDAEREGKELMKENDNESQLNIEKDTENTTKTKEPVTDDSHSDKGRQTTTRDKSLPTEEMGC